MSSHPYPKRIAIMIESHFDDTEPGAFTMFFPANSYSTEFISNLRGNPERVFKGNDTDQEDRDRDVERRATHPEQEVH